MSAAMSRERSTIARAGSSEPASSARAAASAYWPPEPMAATS
jgi:hypothetical protein